MNTENLAAVQPYLGFVHPVMMWVVLLLAPYTLTGVQIVQKLLSQL
jgi:hypothetical protein